MIFAVRSFTLQHKSKRELGMRHPDLNVSLASFTAVTQELCMLLPGRGTASCGF